MLPHEEREAFSQRLRSLLAQSGYPSTSPTWLAREFNIRYPQQPITLHAVRKWLQGEAIPAQDKVRVLAAWLGVKPEWLRYGDERNAASVLAVNEPLPTPQPIDLDLLRRIAQLPPEYRQVVDDLVASLCRLQATQFPVD